MSTNVKDIEFHTDLKGYGYTDFDTDFKDINLHTDFKDYGFSMNKEISGIKLKDDHLVRIEQVKNCPSF